MPQRPPSPARGARLDRRADERTDPDLPSRLAADPRTRIVELRGERAHVLGGAVPDGLDLRPWRDDDADASLLAFLGRDPGGAATLAVVRNAEEQPGPGWRTLRDVGPFLSETHLDAFMTAQALARWHGAHPRCARCGAPTTPALAGWVRRCPDCGREHYPRTDPAVIMAVVDPADRLLLARAPAWPQRRRSVLAGFVEPGEELEAAVVREVAEEVGVVVDDVRYAGSQPWPFPSSLMIGFTARAGGDALRLDDGEIAEADWFTRADVDAGLDDGSLVLPGRLSIARRLVEGWYGGGLHVPTVDDPGSGGGWFRPST